MIKINTGSEFKIHWKWYTYYKSNTCSKFWKLRTIDEKEVTCKNCISRIKKFKKKYV